MQRLDVALLPSEALVMEADAFVVVDVLRATTTIAVLFDRALLDLVVMDRLDAAVARAHSEKRLLFGEVGGLRPEGFDFGNSPVEAQAADVNGRGAVLFTTNGTTALCALGDHATVYAGAPANATAIARSVRGLDRVVVVCAGSEGARRFAQEDFAAAGMLVRTIQRVAGRVVLGDAAALAARLAGTREQMVELPLRGGATRAGTMPAFGEILIGTSEHARQMKELGFERDVHFSARLDTSRAAPMVVECGPGWARLEDRR